jgi:penicillin-insensitive murein endopeptidase
MAMLAVPALLVAQDDSSPAKPEGAAKASAAGRAAARKAATKEAAPKEAPAGEAGESATGAAGSDAEGGKSPKARKAQARKAPSKTAKAAKPRPAPAKELFGAVKTPAPLAARSIGFYAKGCLAGAAALPINGPAWQEMRLSRNRNWGHPELISLIEKLAVEAKEHDGWPGLLVGDISQPRGGPMLTGHASHQIGLDADVWLTPMPDRRLTPKEREEMSATSMLAPDSVSVNPKVWTENHVKLLKRAASYKQVERVLVHPAIKKAVCDATKDDKDRGWLSKIRPYWGHYYHFHVRIACPKGSAGCESQPRVGSDDGCGAELTQWLRRIKPPPVAEAPPPPKPAKPAPPKPQITLDQLPADCRTVLASGTPAPAAPSAAEAKPADAKPADAKATEAKPPEAKPDEAQAADPKPAETAAPKPASSKTPAKAAAAKPAAKPAKPAAAKKASLAE